MGAHGHRGAGLLMCGIAGIYRREGVAEGDLRAATAAAAAQAHRGPDGRGVAASGAIALAHVRLAIVDVAGGRQPLWSEDRRVAVVCNGEIYNHRELRRELEARGHRFSTASDCEVVVHLYEELGSGGVERLRGMFALAIADHGRRRLVLARDRMGEKPLYVAESARGVAFASELKALVAAGWSEDRLDPQAAELFLTFGYVPGPRSILRGVTKLAPACLAEIDEAGMRVRRYWQAPVAADGAADARTDARHDAELVAAVEAALDDAVRARLASEVPLGAFLSGGIDSGLVVSMMAGDGRRVATHTVAFDDPALDESAAAHALAAALGSDHAESRVALDLVADLPRIAWHLDEPFADPSAVPTWYLAREASRRFRVALSGDGGDELFAGYVDRYRMALRERRLRSWVARGGLRRWFARAGERWPRWRRLPRALRLGTVLRNLATSADRAYLLDRALLPPHVAGPLRGARPALDPLIALAPHLEEAPLDGLERALHLDQRTWLPDDGLVKVDRLGMAHGLEVRAPFLDHALVALAAGLPRRLKLSRAGGKVALRRIARARLGAAVASRPKRGFAPPVDAWLRGDLHGFARETLLGAGGVVRELVDAQALADLLEAHRRGRVDAGWPLWGLLMLRLWDQERTRRVEARAGGELPVEGGALAEDVRALAG